jgi:hypothetical protein
LILTHKPKGLELINFYRNICSTNVYKENCQYLLSEKFNAWRAYEKESIFRTLGAVGMSINNELEKKEIRLLASKLDGTSIADSFTVSNR